MANNSIFNSELGRLAIGGLLVGSLLNSRKERKLQKKRTEQKKKRREENIQALKDIRDNMIADFKQREDKLDNDDFS